MFRVVIYCTGDGFAALAPLKAAQEALGHRVAFINSAAFNPAQLENADKVFVHERDVDRISPGYLARKTEVAVIEEAPKTTLVPRKLAEGEMLQEGELPVGAKVKAIGPAAVKPPRKAQTAGSHKPKGKGKA